MTHSRRGLGFILLATVASGVAGYLVIWLVYRVVGSADYAQFAVFWSAFFLLAGGFAGVQQEFARATTARAATSTSPADSKTAHARAWVFTLLTAGVVMVVAFATSPAWMPVVFSGLWVAWATPLALGVAASIVMSATAGSLYGVASWRLIAGLIAGDGVLRLMFIGGGLLAGWPVALLAWLVVLPGPATLVILAAVLVRKLRGKTQLDVTYRGLTWNVARTVLASLATGVLVSGFPVVLAATSRGADASSLGDLIFAITLARAPLIVTVMALQSFLVVQFRNRRQGSTRLLLRIFGLVVAVTVASSILAALIGAPVLDAVAGRPVVFDPWLVPILVASSGAVALIQVSGAYLLSDAHHAAYSIGLVVAAVATAGLLLMPIDLVPRVEWALIVAPILGLLTHLAFALVLRRRVRA
jgi:hypothetical protein